MARKIGVLLVIFVFGYMGSHYYIKWKNRTSFESAVKPKLVECNPNQIREMNISQIHGAKASEFKFRRVDQKVEGMPESTQLALSDWRWISPNADAEAESALLSRVSSMVCEIYEPVPSKAEEMGELPADRPFTKEITVFLEDENGKPQSHSIRFGKITEARKSIIEYKSPAGSKFFQIAPELLQVTSQPEKEYFNMRVMKMALDNAQAASVERNKKEKFGLERDGADWSILVDQKKITQTPEAAKFINRIGTLKAIDIINPNYPAAECEKLGGQIEVDLQGVGSREEKIFFSHAKGGAYIEACNSARNTKFKVHKDMWKYLVTPVKELARK